MDLEVLTTSAEEWCRTKDVELEDYNQIGVHYINSESNYPLKMETIPTGIFKQNARKNRGNCWL